MSISNFVKRPIFVGFKSLDFLLNDLKMEALGNHIGIRWINDLIKTRLRNFIWNKGLSGKYVENLFWLYAKFHNKCIFVPEYSTCSKNESHFSLPWKIIYFFVDVQKVETLNTMAFLYMFQNVNLFLYFTVSQYVLISIIQTYQGGGRR